MRARRRHRRRSGGATRAGRRGWSSSPASGARRGCASTPPARAGPVGRGRAPGAVRGAAIPMRSIAAGHRGAGRIAPPTSATRDEALRELLRSRLGGLGPVDGRRAGAAARGCRARDVDAALLGAAGAKATCCRAASRRGAGRRRAEWCERHLLARIHRYTLKRLRREIEPVEPRDFVRFLFEWQHVGADRAGQRPRSAGRRAGAARRLRGAGRAVGSRDPAGARAATTRAPWLDDLCTAGRTLWTRLRPPAGDGPRAAARRRCARRRSCCCRGAARALDARSRRRRPTTPGSARARSAWSPTTSRRTARRSSTRSPTARACCAAELEDALGELVARGRVHCDSYAGLRALLRAGRRSARRRTRAGAAAPRCSASRTPAAGRWSRPPRRGRRRARQSRALRAGRATPMRSSTSPASCCGATASSAGACSSARRRWLPPWRDLVRVYRRLEARGEIRGGRFIAGLSGEQFALPEAIGARCARCGAGRADDALGLPRRGRSGQPARHRRRRARRSRGSPAARVLYRDGVPVATSVGGEVEALLPLDRDALRAASDALRQGPVWRLPAAAPRLENTLSS